MANVPEVVRLVENPTREDIVSYTGDRHPNRFSRVPRETRAAVVGEDLEVVRVVRQEPADEIRVFPPLASHREASAV